MNRFRSTGLKLSAFLYILFSGFLSTAQVYIVSGKISESTGNNSLETITIALKNDKVRYALTDHSGHFQFNNLQKGNYRLDVSAIGYEATHMEFDLSSDKVFVFSLKPTSINLKEITVQTPYNLKQNNSFTQIDKELRPVNTAQDLLQLVPGLFLAQHAGGGKAEQIFLRGFDNDHGTDFFISVDGMPVNMVSHAHGQGYADFHFVIPETIEKLSVFKGPYMAKFGDFSTGGTGEFTTKSAVENSMIKMEVGQFNTIRTMGMFDLLGPNATSNQHFYMATEYVHTDSYFDKKQNFNRFNAFAKYQGQLSKNSYLQASASYFNGGWTGSGQIPERAVESGLISRFGQLDSSEGGKTSRTNLNVILSTNTADHALIKNQVYYTHYDFSLFSDFTFFLNDPVHGDEIHQSDNRSILGYNGSYQKEMSIGSMPLSTTLGLSARMDFTQVSLNHSQRRFDFESIVDGGINQINTSAYIDFDIHLSDQWMLNAGSRVDHFSFGFNDHLLEQNNQKNISRISPKLNLFYQLNTSVRFFAKSGLGFHSNDARSVVLGRSENSLPKVFGYETGTEMKLGSSFLMNVALWTLHAQSELVYVGDEGVVETNNPTKRLGVDLGFRYQFLQRLFADLDLNYNHGRLEGVPEGENYLPLAPTITSTGGLQYKQVKGLNAGLRYRYMASKAAIEDNSIRTREYMIWDLSLLHKTSKVDYGFTIENLFNTDWNQAQFNTLSRLKNETSPVEELHFTPGTKFFFKASLSYKF